MNTLKNLYYAVDGYKTFIVALCGFIYGVATGNVEIVLASLGMFGFRDALNKK